MITWKNHSILNLREFFPSEKYKVFTQHAAVATWRHSASMGQRENGPSRSGHFAVSPWFVWIQRVCFTNIVYLIEIWHNLQQLHSWGVFIYTQLNDKMVNYSTVEVSAWISNNMPELYAMQLVIYA